MCPPEPDCPLGPWLLEDFSRQRQLDDNVKLLETKAPARRALSLLWERELALAKEGERVCVWSRPNTQKDSSERICVWGRPNTQKDSSERLYVWSRPDTQK